MKNAMTKWLSVMKEKAMIKNAIQEGSQKTANFNIGLPLGRQQAAPVPLDPQQGAERSGRCVPEYRPP